MKTDAKQLARGLFAEIQSRGPEELDAVTEAFVEHLTNIHELSLWREVVRAFDSIWKETYGVANVDIVSATELSKDLQKMLEEKFSGASITLHVDESVLGGASVRIDDKIIDGTISGRLQSLKQQLTT